MHLEIGSKEAYMDAHTAERILMQKEPPRLFDAVRPALQEAELRDFLVEHAFDKDETVRYNCVRVLSRAIDQQPALFYQYWDRFAPMVSSSNGFHRSFAAQCIAMLAPVDRDCKLDAILDAYLRLRDDPKVMVSHYFIETLDRICLARPELQQKVVTALLDINKGKHTQQHKDLLGADVLATLDRLHDRLPADLRKKALLFAKAAAASSSPKTRKAAKTYLAARAA